MDGSHHEQGPVLVAGAGPVGIAAAAWLAQWGIPVRVIDAAPAPSSYSKALVVWRQSLAALDPLVPVESWAQSGSAAPVKRITIFDGGRLIGCIPFDAGLSAGEGAAAEGPAGHALPAGLLLSQADTVALLEAAAKHRGVAVEYGVRLRSFEVLGQGQEGGGGGGGVECVLEHGCADGAGGDPLAAAAAAVASDGDQQAAPGGGARTERVRAAFLIGADGAHSVVRKGLGLPFEGRTLGRRFWLADVTVEPPIAGGGANDGAKGHPSGGGGGGGGDDRELLETRLTPGQMYANTTPSGTMFLLPFANGMLRFMQDMGPVDPSEPRGAPTVETVQAAIDKYTRLGLRVTGAAWLAEFRINERLAASYVAGGGRVILAGDATHVHSPAGGQGMNLGLQDATALAWRVALAYHAAAGPKVLPSYEAERRPIAQGVIRLSGLLLRSAMIRSPLLHAIRHRVLGLLMQRPSSAKKFTSRLAGDQVAYPKSPLAGRRARDGGQGGGGKGGGAEGGGGRGRGALLTPSPFPDLPVTIGGRLRPAVELLRFKPGEGLGAKANGGGDAGSQGPCASTMGTLVLGPRAAPGDWPAAFGPWLLAVRRVGVDLEEDARSAALMAALGAAPNGGALVRPDRFVAAVGGPAQARAWLGAHASGPNGVDTSSQGACMDALEVAGLACMFTCFYLE